MVKPPLRTKSIGFKVSEEEYAQLETAAQAERSDAGRVVPRGDPAGRVGQRCREARSGAGRDRRSALAAGERVGACGGGREGDAGEWTEPNRKIGHTPRTGWLDSRNQDRFPSFISNFHYSLVLRVSAVPGCSKEKWSLPLAAQVGTIAASQKHPADTLGEKQLPCEVHDG